MGKDTKYLRLVYFADSNCLHFASEDIQTLLIRAMDISKAIHFSIMDFETLKFIPDNNLLCSTDSFYDLIQEAEDSLRFPGFSAEFSNGIKLVGDLNLSYLYSECIETLFQFSSLIFNEFDLKTDECKNLLLNNPGQILDLCNFNGQLRYTIIPFEI
jgi:hypothetical protein